MSGEDHFVEHFRQSDAPAGRGAFLSRVFGIFSEEIVRIWCRDERSPYRNLGRPTVRYGEKHYTLDHLFQSRETGRIYVVEQKCEIEYRNYRYLILRDAEQLKHHKKEAFAAFLAVTHEGARPQVSNRGVPVEVDGAILAWGSVNPESLNALKGATGLFDILSLSDIIRDLRQWRSPEYLQLVEDRRQWSAGLFSWLGDM